MSALRTGPELRAVPERTDVSVMPLVLCDFAQIREGLLFIASGGISRVYRNSLPAPLGLSLAMIVDLATAEVGRSHTLSVTVYDRTGVEVAGVDATFNVGDEGVFQQERQHVPFVVSLADLEITVWGTHDVVLRLDGHQAGTVSFYVLPTEAF